eukprot:1160986-Pelagomonas_calceolata.AAC.5
MRRLFERFLPTRGNDGRSKDSKVVVGIAAMDKKVGFHLDSVIVASEPSVPLDKQGLRHPVGSNPIEHGCPPL